VRLRPEGATPKTPHGPRRYKKGLGVRISEVAHPGQQPARRTEATQPLWTASALVLAASARGDNLIPGLRGTRVLQRSFPSHAGQLLVWVWTTIATADAAATSRLARAEDASRAAAEAVLMGAGSLLAAVFTLTQAGHARAAITVSSVAALLGR
jgi:hypothetical protein